MIIDWHSHWLPADMADSVARYRDLPVAREFSDTDARLRFMDAAGVSRQVISWPTTFGLDAKMPVASTASLYRDYNDRLAELHLRWPDRFSALAAVPCADPEVAARELSRAMSMPGFIGAVVPADAFLTPEISALFTPLLSEAQRLRCHIYVHPGPTGLAGGEPIAFLRCDTSEARWLLEAGARLAASAVTLECSGVLDPYPDVTVHVAMLGGHLGWIAETLVERASKRAEQLKGVSPLRRIYVDTGIVKPGGGALALAVSVFGSDRILFGSDFPQFSTLQPAVAFAAAGLPAEVQSKILFENGNLLIRREGKPALP